MQSNNNSEADAFDRSLKSAAEAMAEFDEQVSPRMPNLTSKIVDELAMRFTKEGDFDYVGFAQAVAERAYKVIEIDAQPLHINLSGQKMMTRVMVKLNDVAPFCTDKGAVMSLEERIDWLVANGGPDHAANFKATKRA